MANFQCKWCGKSHHSSARELLKGGCARNPNGNLHELYEGSEKSQYTCKYCGRQYASIDSMTKVPCIKHPNKGWKHEPAL